MQKAEFLKAVESLKKDVDEGIVDAKVAKDFWVELTSLNSVLYTSAEVPLSDWLVMAGQLIALLNTFSVYSEKRFSEYADPALVRAVHAQHDWTRVRLQVPPVEDDNEP